jgi:hypothetical protein
VLVVNDDEDDDDACAVDEVWPFSCRFLSWLFMLFSAYDDCLSKMLISCAISDGERLPPRLLPGDRFMLLSEYDLLSNIFISSASSAGERLPLLAGDLLRSARKELDDLFFVDPNP